MTLLALGGMLTGMVLGIRFRVYILIPFLFVGSVVGIVLGLARANDLIQTILWILAGLVPLQLGYLCSSLVASNISDGLEERSEGPTPGYTAQRRLPGLAE
ncbi:hypothetical protein [Bradyrhizobium sp. Gha]|uniref:hypothetical protein n=1 Tax=Bradyrhizobium sp. Gha TaxID=1855318 RepID=UPI0008E35B54|nr:hypothetical protein [Bradyrhizobium sp. Gha]SFI08545.1 hypothetical protein SAMN05216525_10425 [Bradyrhizobium sp. Gha]